MRAFVVTLVFAEREPVFIVSFDIAVFVVVSPYKHCVCCYEVLSCHIG